MSIKHITKQNFKEEVLEKEGTVLLDFWATWCGPCRMLSPIVDQVAQEVENKATVAKVNIDGQPELAEALGIMSIPTLMVFKDGKNVDKSVGVRSKKAILNMID